jgi:hypothetical protein
MFVEETIHGENDEKIFVCCLSGHDPNTGRVRPEI